MSTIRKFVIATMVCAALTACSKPTEVVLPTDVSQWNDDFAKKIKGLSDGDKQLLAGYMARVKVGHAFGGQDIPPGTTVGQAIDAQKQWIAQQDQYKAQQEQLKQQLQAKQAAAAAELSKTIVMTFLEQKHVPQDFHAGRYENQWDIRIGVKNTGTKALKGVRGLLIVKNTFGDVITQTRLNIEADIPPGGDYVWNGSRKLNQFDSEDQKLMSLEDGKFSTEILPILAVFADGSKVGVSDDGSN
ncbi:hypothetical protein QF000_006978 [Paraburkholderia atlantica]|uniref:hypothetical protein n=1 Tax=Paraburkholderia atlantica TaxID=2654982 RepID=UPI003D216DEC